MRSLVLHLRQLCAEAPGVPPWELLAHAIRRANRDLLSFFSKGN